MCIRSSMMTAAALIGYITRNPCKKTSVWPVKYEKSVHLYHPANAPTAVAEQKKAAESWAPRCTPTGQLAATLSVQLFAQTATPSAVQPLSNLLFNSARMQVRLARSRIIRLQTPAIDRKRMGAAQPQSGTLRAKER